MSDETVYKAQEKVKLNSNSSSSTLDIDRRRRRHCCWPACSMSIFLTISGPDSSSFPVS